METCKVLGFGHVGVQVQDPDLYPRGEKFAMFRGPDNERLQLEQIL
ncbi:MAG: hypothetical protein PUJ35_00430 [Ruminococcus bromii]|nr:hypothetical protein [Ruminococcus bromii]